MGKTFWTGIFTLALIISAHAQTSSPPAPDPETNGLSRAEIRELLDAVKETAKSSRENVNYSRSVPDILFQILGKLDKIENKLDKVEEAVRRQQAASRKR